MNKEQFLAALSQRLRYLPLAEVEKSLSFYEECINDRMEDGMSEWEAVAALGDMEAIAREIETSLPLATVVKQRVKKESKKQARSGGSKWVWIVLAVLGCPVWLSLLAALVIAVLAVYVSLWAVVLAVFAVPVVLIIVGVVLLIYAMVKAVSMSLGGLLMLLGGAAVLVGLALALLVPLCWLAKGFGRLTLRFGRWVKGLILGKGGSEI